MSAEDYMPDSVDEDDPGHQGTTCNRCGATGLEWHDTGVRWRLIEPGGRFKYHICKQIDVSGDFDVVG